MAALDIHSRRITLRDRMYLVDFQKFSGDERLYEVDLIGGRITAFRTCHGRGSDPEHSGFARRFSNTPESFMSSVGAYATAGAGWGAQQGPNVLLDGLEYSNDLARDRAIIIHGADYADPEFLAREGKLGLFLHRPHRSAHAARAHGRGPTAVRLRLGSAFGELRGVSDLDDPDLVLRHRIAGQVGRDGQQMANASPNWSPPVGEVNQAFGGCHQPRRQTLRSNGIETVDAVVGHGQSIAAEMRRLVWSD